MRGTCSRLQVGCVIADITGRIVQTGYNGTPAGRPHCKHLDDSPCQDAIHAESNAILWAGRNGISVVGCTLYCTHTPCWDCSKQIVTAGIIEVVYGEEYRSQYGITYLRDHLTEERVRQWQAPKIVR